MAALQGIKRRIKSVRNTRQITKAMQMVEASKLRRAQLAALGPQAYMVAAKELLARLASGSAAKLHPWFIPRPVKHDLTIVIAADRGMAGAYNSNVLKALGRHLHGTNGSKHMGISVGKRAALQLARASDINEVATFGIDRGDADIAIARPVLEESIQLYNSGDVDAVHLIYTHFISTVHYEVITKQLLPVTADEGLATEAELEPEADELLEFAARRVLEAEVLQAVLEARASENASRMLSMKNATDNAEDLISDLTLAFNNARQTSITQEIAEISAGAEAITE
jgi:F-type H+-transporting ATPase subunit gamma